MAQQDLVFKVKIDGTEREIKSLKDLKQAKKDATDAFLKGDKDAAKALAELKDKTEDLADATRSLKTDGVEPLTGSFGLFKEGLGSGDFDKIKLGFKGVGAAMSAIPIFLLIEGFKLLIENFDELVKFFDTGKTKAEQMTVALEEQKKALSVLSTTIGNQIKILEAQGNSEEKILALKKELVAIGIKQAEGDILLQKQKIKEIILNDSLFESGQKLLAQQQRAVGNTLAAEAIEKSIAIDKQKRIKEAADALTQDYLTIQSLRTEDAVNEIKTQKEKDKKSKDLKKDKLAEDQKLFEEVYNQEAKNQDALLAQENAARDKQKAAEKEARDQSIKDMDELFKQLSIIQDQELNKQLAVEKEFAEKKKGITIQGLQTVQNISDFFFSVKQANLKKGSEEEEKAARKQFQINKAVQLATATISAIQGVLNASSAKSVLPEPFATGFRIANVVSAIAAGAAAVAKISATQFNSTGFSSQSSGSSNAGGSMPNINTNAPTTQAEPQQVTTFTGNNNNNFQPVHIKADIVETEMRSVMDRQNKFKKESEFG